MKKCCFLIPYFGKLPTYFNFFLKTCQKNQNYDWKIFTDDDIQYEIPDNVQIFKMNIDQCKKLISKKLGEEFPILDAHKLCDYKPAYGYIFEEYIPYDKYMSWGHCDLDILLGNLDNFITEEALHIYDKLFCLGHLIIYKNNYQNNRLFMKDINKRKMYLESFRNPKTTIFDETHGNRDNVNTIFEYYGKKILTDDYSFNVKILPTRFVRIKFIYDKYGYESEKYKNCLYLWDNGSIYRFYESNNEIIKEEYMYMHFQQRKISYEPSCLQKKYFQIIPNKFCAIYTNEIDLNTFRKIKKNRICFHYLDIKKRHLKEKIRKR